MSLLKCLKCFLPTGLLWAVAASAQTNVYKCVDAAQPVYQQTPCQGRAEWRWEVEAEGPAARAAVPPPVASGRAGPVRKPRRGHAQGALISINDDPRGCERVRRQQAATLARPRRLDYLQRRQLDDAVRAACR